MCEYDKGLWYLKTLVPDLPKKYLKRNILTEELLAHYSLVILHAAAGYGKTVEATEYYQQYSRDCVWCNIDKTDNDYRKFLEVFIYLLQNKFENFCLEETEEKFFSTPHKDALFLLGNILKDNRNKEKSLIIIYDKFQKITNPLIVEFLAKLMEYGRGMFKFILCTKDKISDVFIRFIVQGQCKILTDEQLKFNVEETEELMKNFLEFSVEQLQMEARSLCGITQGWPVAIMLALIYQRTQMQYCLVIDWNKNLKLAYIDGFLVHEVWMDLSEEDKEFMIQTSILDELNEENCNIVLNREDSGTILETLIQKCLFLSRVPLRPNNYKYKVIFREFLQKQISNKNSHELFERAARHYLEKNDSLMAVKFALEGKNERILADILVNNGINLLLNDAEGLLGKAFSFLINYPEVLTPDIWFVFGQYYYMNDDYLQMEYCLNEADICCGKENLYGISRGFYKSLLNYEKNPIQMKEQINHALFFFEENKFSMPLLLEKERKTLNLILKEREKTEEENSKKENFKLKVSLFGRLKVVAIADGKEISWRTRKGSELFAYLIQRKGNPVDRKTLLQELWYEEMPDNAVAMLHNMFYNIRKELSFYRLDSLVQCKNRKYSLDVSQIQTDLEQIQIICRLIDKNDRSSLQEYKEQLAVYWGGYLEEIDNEWVKLNREYYETDYIKGCTLLAQNYMQVGSLKEAANFYKNALLVNPFSEELTIKLMSCYGELGDLRLVKKLYKEYCNLLEKEFNIKPGKKFIESYRQCVAIQRERGK